MARPIFKIYLSGRFRIIGTNGREVRLASAKAQGVVALLATESHLTRQRPWIQDKLWSSSEPEKGANSLRQVLFQIRKAFGEDARVLEADRTTVRLDAGSVGVVEAEEGEFLEGIDVDDPEFESWLLTERVRRLNDYRPDAGASPVAAPANKRRPSTSRHKLVIECSGGPATSMRLAEERFGALIQKSIREFIDIELVAPSAASDASDAIALRILARGESAGQIVLRAAIYKGAVHVPLWSDSASGTAPRLDGDFGASLLNLCYRSSAALVDLLVSPNECDPDDDANFLAGTALRHMYSLLPGGLAQAAKLLERAYEVSSKGRYLAWRAQLAAIEYVESGGERLAELAEQSDELCYKAIAAEGTNSSVLAAVANARLVLEDDRVAAAELSKLAVQVNSANPLAWDAWSYALVSIGNHKSAYSAALTAQALSRDTHFRYSAEFQVATTAAAVGRKSEAIKRAERARALNPRYTPALRYLVGLYADADDFGAARTSLARLQRIEPDATASRFVSDPDYPVKMMRRAGLVDAGRFADI